MDIVQAPANLVFYYFGMRVEYNSQTNCVSFNHSAPIELEWLHAEPALENEILYRLQDNVHVAPDGCRTFREVFDIRRNKWANVLVPMLVNMQEQGADDVMRILAEAEFPDVPY